MGLVPPSTSRLFRLYRRGAAGSTRDAAAHCNREPSRHRPQLVPRQPLPPGRQPRAPATPRPSAMLGVASKATAGSTYRCPAGGELPAGASRPTATGTHTSGRGGGGEKGGRAACANRTQESGYQSVSPPKNGDRAAGGVWGQEGNPEAILGGKEATVTAPEAAPRRLPQNSPRPRLPR